MATWLGPGATDAPAAARDVIGAQAQAVGTGILALSQRTKGRPTAKKVAAMFAGKSRKLVRIWGQRGTMHMYDPRDWATIIAAFQTWAPNQRRGPMPNDATLDEALSSFEDQATRRDILEVAPASYLRALKKAHGKYLAERDAPHQVCRGTDPLRLVPPW